MPCITGFIGRHNSGKTTIIRKVITELKTRGYSIGVFKSTHHNIDFHSPGKDTSLYIRDGVECVAIKGPAELAVFQSIPDESLERTVCRLFPDQDIVILEGFKNVRGIPKIEVAVNAAPGLYEEVKEVRAVITGNEVPGRICLDPDRPSEVADFLESGILKEHEREDEVSIFINNRRLPMKHFVRNAAKGIIIGFLQSLKFTAGARKIDIRIEIRKPY